MHPLAVLFDMDGLMLDSERMARKAWTRALADYGFPLKEEEYLGLLGRSVQDAQMLLREMFGPDLPFQEVFQRRQSYYDTDIVTNGIPLKPGLLELLDFLEEKNIPKAVASSTPGWFAKVKLEHADLARRFPVIVSGDQVALAKPAPDLFLEAARRLGFSASDCVALEDSEAGVRSAFEAGALPLMVPDLKPPAVDIAALAYRVLPSLYDVIPLMQDFIEHGLPARRGSLPSA